MDALRGLRVLVAGDDLTTIEAARSGLAAQGALAEVCIADPAVVARKAAGGDPPVVPVLDLVGPRDPFDATAARRLRALVQLSAVRARACELEGVVASQAVSRRRELEAARLD